MSNLIATTSGNDYGALDGFKVFAPNKHSSSVDVSKEAVDVSEQQTVAQFVPPVFDENQVRLIRDLAEDRLVEVCEKGDVREMGLDGVIELAGAEWMR